VDYVLNPNGREVPQTPPPRPPAFGVEVDAVSGTYSRPIVAQTETARAAEAASNAAFASQEIGLAFGLRAFGHQSGARALEPAVARGEGRHVRPSPHAPRPPPSPASSVSRTPAPAVNADDDSLALEGALTTNGARGVARPRVRFDRIGSVGGVAQESAPA
jgi:hypothetical protein